MKTKKKSFRLALLLSMVLVFSTLFYGCSQEDTSTTTETVTEQPMIPATDETEEVATDDTSVANDTSEETTTEDITTEEATTEEATDADSEEVKTIGFTVVYSDGTSEDFSIETSAATLREALEQEGLISGTDSEYGLYVQTVNGVTANEDNQEWWCLTKGGEMWSNGVDTTEISDGDQYEFTLTVGW